jgi:hypothetical protein
VANQWGADVPVSMPQPLRADQEAIVAMGGFVMTLDGLFPDMSAADHERLSTPVYAPFNPQAKYEELIPDPEEV